jgi:hypothetical protein
VKLLLVLLILLGALAMSSCLVRTVHTRRLTGTCEGASDHDLQCKGGSDDARTCVADCRQVFSDGESLRAFESLSCADTIEYVEGRRAMTSSP